MNDKDKFNGESFVGSLIKLIDKDAEREGLIDTPKRYLKFLHEFTNPADFNFTTFDAQGMDEMIIVKKIQFYSLCEHHLAPFFGLGYIAYIPNDKIVGISKLPRVLHMFSRKFQNQERITQQVATYLMENLKPKGVAVLLTARHMCMEMRGVQAMGAETSTNAMIGCFKDDAKCRLEFFNSIKI